MEAATALAARVCSGSLIIAVGLEDGRISSARLDEGMSSLVLRPAATEDGPISDLVLLDSGKCFVASASRAVMFRADTAGPTTQVKGGYNL